MKRFLWSLMLITNFIAVNAQQDSIYINAKLSAGQRQISVNQEITFTNRTASPLNKIKLLNWISAYKNQSTPLVNRKLEDRKTDMHFTKADELGSTSDLEVKISGSLVQHTDISQENLFIPLSKPLMQGEKINISLQYRLNLPLQKFTRYGTDGKSWHLKYFFIVPDGFENDTQPERYYIDIEENQSAATYWKVNLDVPAQYYSYSNLNEIQPNYFEGELNKDPEFLITDNRFPSIESEIDGQKISVSFGYPITENERINLESLLPQQLRFIKDRIGSLPGKIFISQKFRQQENFTGIDDLKFWKFHYRLFSELEQADLNYFSVLSKNIVEQSSVFDKSADHWIVNGVKTYLEIQYIDRHYKDRKLLGDLPENAKIFGTKPLKFFHASKLKLSERYGLAYQYILTQNLDQAIGIPFEKLSNFNAMTVSHFEMGSLLSFIAEKMGKGNFDTFLRHYFSANSATNPDSKAFTDALSLASGYSSDFLEPFIQHKNRVNFKLKRFSKKEDQFEVKISKNTELPIPFKIETAADEGASQAFWFDTDDSKNTEIYRIPISDATKIVVNDEYIFPETNFRDNYLYTKGLFANTKRIKLKLFQDIPNPEYNEIYVNPRITFNAYDKILVGLNVRNTSFFQRKFNYSITPYFSSGTGKLAGNGAIGYTIQPAESFFRSLDLAVSASHFHYDYDLTYRKFSAGAGMNFSKDPRSAIGRSLAFSYNYFEKDLNPDALNKNEYGKYNLWNLSYGYSDRRAIHEKYLGANLQWMEDFQKISAEASYRWEYAHDKKIFFRFFGGYFISNKTVNSLFDYGISRVSNYSFSYGLLGQSATSGIFSQQLILAEGGFKSNVGSTANKWIAAVNVDSHVWRWFNIYADAGMYKNKHERAQFIWDSGIKLKVIPDFLEIYFPVQSSLGFEPSFKDYAQRIRFTLVLNLNAVTSHLRRGWF